MKKFVISAACNMCGECCLRTDMLAEDSVGRAVPVVGKYIENLPVAEEIAASCPVNAILIEDIDVAGNSLPESLTQLTDLLKKEFDEIEFTIPDVTYKETDYNISCGYAAGENRFDYSSEQQAKNAAILKFEQVYWSRRADFVLDILSQYKSKFLRPFYDFDNKETNYFLSITKQFNDALAEIFARAMYLTNGNIQLPDGFASFRLNTEDIKPYTKDLENFGEYYGVKNLIDYFAKEESFRESKYTDSFFIESDSVVIGRNWLGADKLKWTYSFEGVNEKGHELIEDLLFYVGWNNHFRNIGDIAEETIKYAVEAFKSNIKKDAETKLSVLSKSISLYISSETTRS